MARYVPTLRRAAPAVLLAALTLLARPAYAATDGPVDLGTAESFAVLAGAGITNTNATTITGDVGTFPTTSRTGFDTVTLIGADHGGDAVTQGAKNDLVTAYDDAAGRLPVTAHAVELGGDRLLPGVYASETFGLTGTLTLDAQGDPNAQFVFQMEKTLIAEADSRVLLTNGANPCQVVWQVGSSATFKTRTQFVGDVLAYTSISAQGGATFAGRLLARNGAVTLDNNTITNAACTAGTAPTSSPTAAPTSAPPGATPSTTPGATASVSPAATAGVTPRPATTPRASGLVANRGGTPLLPDTGNTPGALALAAFALFAVGGVLLMVGDSVGYRRGTHRR